MANTKIGVGVFTVPSESSDAQYTLRISKRGRGLSVTCTCWGYRRHRHCKHATAARNGEYVTV
jgi:hypothetical protein